MDLKNITQKFLNKKKKYKKDIFIINPDMYWKSVLLFSVCVVFGFFAFGYYLLNQVNKEVSNDEPVNVVKLETANKGKLQNLIEYFSKKAQLSEDIINNPSRVVDPSL